MKLYLNIIIVFISTIGVCQGQGNGNRIVFSEEKKEVVNNASAVSSLDKRDADLSIVDQAETENSDNSTKSTIKEGYTSTPWNSYPEGFEGDRLNKNDETSTSSAQDQFYVIVGSSLDKVYAERIAQDAVNKGFSAEAIYFNEDKTYRVCILTNSRNKKNILDKARMKMTSNAWVLPIE